MGGLSREGLGTSLWKDVSGVALPNLPPALGLLCGCSFQCSLIYPLLWQATVAVPTALPFLFYFLFLFVVLGMEPRAWCMLAKHFTT
jgi:hypothetical protein